MAVIKEEAPQGLSQEQVEAIKAELRREMMAEFDRQLVNPAATYTIADRQAAVNGSSRGHGLNDMLNQMFEKSRAILVQAEEYEDIIFRVSGNHPAPSQHPTSPVPAQKDPENVVEKIIMLLQQHDYAISRLNNANLAMRGLL